MGLLLNKIILAVVGVVLAGGVLLLVTVSEKKQTAFDQFALPEEEVRVPFGESSGGTRRQVITPYFEGKKTTGNFLLDAISGITSSITKTLGKDTTSQTYTASEMSGPPSNLPGPIPDDLVVCLPTDENTLSGAVLFQISKYFEAVCPHAGASLGLTNSVSMTNTFYNEWKKGCEDTYEEDLSLCPLTNLVFIDYCTGFKSFFSKLTSGECGPGGGGIGGGGIPGGGQGGGTPFGGKVKSVDYSVCTCSPGNKIIKVGEPNSAELMITPSTKIYAEYNTDSTGQWVIGLYQKGGTCSYGDECELTYTPSEGTATSIGTSQN
ncbi:MAG: hypothetical protein NUV42_00280 [Candidatus Yonathbacteria bacterium]|nr:hypothetical protein [Candidatus Yonathbacteria bacterium]